MNQDLWRKSTCYGQMLWFESCWSHPEMQGPTHVHGSTSVLCKSSNGVYACHKKFWYWWGHTSWSMTSFKLLNENCGSINRTLEFNLREPIPIDNDFFLGHIQINLHSHSAKDKRDFDDANKNMVGDSFYESSWSNSMHGALIGWLTVVTSTCLL
jgi:hypothetical protein